MDFYFILCSRTSPAHLEVLLEPLHEELLHLLVVRGHVDVVPLAQAVAVAEGGDQAGDKLKGQRGKWQELKLTSKSTRRRSSGDDALRPQSPPS